jgi:hypothetical protein
LQPLERFIDRQQFVVGGRGCRFEAFERTPFGRAAAPLTAAPPRVFDQHAAHRFRGSREEMAAAVPVLSLLDIDQPDVRLVDQGRRLERLAGLLLSQLLRRQLAQLLVDQG